MKWWAWSLGCLIGLAIGEAIGPLMLLWLHIGWYARQPGAHMSMLRVSELSWAVTSAIVWLMGSLILGFGKLLTR